MLFEVLNAVNRILRRFNVEIVRSNTDVTSLIPEITEYEEELIRTVKPYTMTSVERMWSLIKSLQYINANGIEGDIVECGVYHGGNIFLARLHQENRMIANRYWLFDTFEGMSSPGELDVTYYGRKAYATYNKMKRGENSNWTYASLEKVCASAKKIFGDLNGMEFVKGKVEDTLKDDRLPDRIALLRLDTDWYESTKIELEVLYPKLVNGGVLIIDDYGHWQGARRAVDEYFSDSNCFMHRIDRTGRLIIKGL